MFFIAFTPGACAPYENFFFAPTTDKFVRVDCLSENGNSPLQVTLYSNADCSDAGTISSYPLCFFDPSRASARAQFSCPAAPPAAASSPVPVAAIVGGVFGAAIVSVISATLVFVKSLRDALMRRLCSRDDGTSYKAMPLADIGMAYPAPKSTSFPNKT